MASKVPKFGAWEGGENYTVYFDNARKLKNNGGKINPNDPEENPDMFPQKGAPVQPPPSHRNAESQGQQSKVPQFGAWYNGDNVGYTVDFENVQKPRTGVLSKTENEPKINRDMHPSNDPVTQPHPATIKPEPQEARTKMPNFGSWEGGGEVAYTACFDNIRKTKNGSPGTEEPSNGNELKQDMTPHTEPPAQEAPSKVPQFGAWNGGGHVAYMASFDNARKNKAEPVEPQLNRDVGERARLPTAATKARSDENMGREGVRSRSEQRSSREENPSRNVNRGSTAPMHGKQNTGGQSPHHSKGGKPQPKSGGRGSQTPERGTTIPPFGVWNQDPSQAEGFTGTFLRAREDRMTPNRNPSASHQQTQHSNEEAKKGCCFSCFR